MRFSIVIPTKNRPEELRKMFASLMIQTKLPDQIIVIDQSSDDKIIKNELKRVLKKKEIEFNYLCNNKIKGLVEAKFYSLNYCKYEIISFFDDDIVLQSDYIEKIDFTFEKYPEVIGANGVILNMPKKNYLKRLFFKITHVGIFSDNRYEVVNSINKKKSEPLLVNTLSGGLSSWRKEVFKQVDFDVKNHFHSYEDKEFSIRVNKKYPNGMYIIPQAKLNHFHSEINRETIIKLIKMNVFEIMIIYKKNRGSSFFGLDLLLLLFSLMTKAFLRSLLNFNIGEIKSFFLGFKDGYYYKIKVDGR